MNTEPKTYMRRRGQMLDIFTVHPSYVDMIDGCETERERTDLLYMGGWAKSWWITHQIVRYDIAAGIR